MCLDKMEFNINSSRVVKTGRGVLKQITLALVGGGQYTVHDCDDVANADISNQLCIVTTVAPFVFSMNLPFEVGLTFKLNGTIVIAASYE